MTAGARDDGGDEAQSEGERDDGHVPLRGTNSIFLDMSPKQKLNYHTSISFIS